MDSEELVRIIKELIPICVVCPDSPGNLMRTVAMGRDFRKLLTLERAQVQTMQVVHAEDGDLKGFELAYKTASLHNIWVAFSRLTKSYGTPGETWVSRRPLFIKHLIRSALWQRDKRHHCLGMNRGSLIELLRLSSLEVADCSAVESIDSSAPIWRGLNGYSLDEAWPDYQFRLDQPHSTAGEAEAEQNLTQVLSACRGSL